MGTVWQESPTLVGRSAIMYWSQCVNHLGNGDFGNLIQIIEDPSHKGWVLGGLFRELHRENPYLFKELIALPAPRNLLGIRLWTRALKEISRTDTLLFSSLTPLLNYTRIPHLTRKSIKLWFTHKEGIWMRSELRALAQVSTIFVHSSKARSQLSFLKDTDIHVVIGALDPTRFLNDAVLGSDILWVGTPEKRKNPELFLEIAESNPRSRFRLYGRNWEQSIYWKRVQFSSNISYREISGPLTSSDFDGCSIFLMTSTTEGGPMPLLEATAAGLMPIYTDTGFASDLSAYIGLPFCPTLPNTISFTKRISECQTEVLDFRASKNFQRARELTLNRLAETIKNS